MSYDREELLQKLTFSLAMNPSISMTELAKKNEISRASLNRIFSSKDNLQEVILQKVQEVCTEISKILNKNHANFMDDLKNVIANFYDNRNYILFICRDVFSDCLDEKILQQQEFELTNFFIEGQKQNLITKTIPAEIITNIFLGNVTWLLCMQAEANNIAADDLQKIILETFLNGIGEKNR